MPLVVWRQPGGYFVGRPDGDFTFLYPRGAVDMRGRLHLFWAEPDELQHERPAASWPSQRPSILYTGVYDKANGWSEPKILERAPRLLWELRGGWELGSASTAQHLVVIDATARGTPEAVYYSMAGDKWIRKTATLHRPPAYVSIARNDRHVFLAYAAADRLWSRAEANPYHRDVNSVFLIVSSDNGETWSSPRLVSQSGVSPAFHVQVLSSGTKLHLTWKQSARDGPLVRHLSSIDDGITWSTPHDLDPATQFEGLRTVLDRCGNMHVIYEDWRGGPTRVHLDYATFTDGWSAPIHLFDASFAITPDLQLNSAGEPVLAFVGSRNGESDPEAQMTLVSSLKLRR